MKSIAEVKTEIEEGLLARRARDTEDIKAYLRTFEADGRKGVADFVKKKLKNIDALERERERLFVMSEYEREYGACELICGIDEVGRGPLAGPVMAGAVILPRNCEILYLNDSKKLTEKKREELCLEIKEKAVAWAVGEASPGRIDEINILNATYEAMRNAINALGVKPDILLNDAVIIPEVEIRQVKIIKGDAKSVSIAAASIVAKVTRDHYMMEMDEKYPGYGFAANKGYGSESHIAALRRLGSAPIHRRSFIGNFV